MVHITQGLAPARAQGPPMITAAPVMGIMLGLLTGCDDPEERLATLTTLKRLVGKHTERRRAVVSHKPNHGASDIKHVTSNKVQLSKHRIDTVPYLLFDAR